MAASYPDEKEFATKNDLKEVESRLELKIAAVQHNLLKSVIWTGATLFVSLGGMLGGMIGHGFHWF